MLRALILAAAVAAAAVLAPSSSAAPSTPGQPLTLQIWPGGGPQRTGSAHTLEAQVARANGGVANGVTVDFEITEGPGDDDAGTAGATPETPDLSCVTAGGSGNRPATCTVTYVEADNVGGSDAVLAWIDSDDLDATVEADLGEGENQHAPGPGGCTVDSKGPGGTEEPDATDCVEKRWIARVPAAIDLTPETGWADVGPTATLDAVVLDSSATASPDRGPPPPSRWRSCPRRRTIPATAPTSARRTWGRAAPARPATARSRSTPRRRARMSSAPTSPATSRRARRPPTRRSSTTARTSSGAHGAWSPPLPGRSRPRPMRPRRQ